MDSALPPLRIPGLAAGTTSRQSGLLGVAALEDVLEELVGEIRDETLTLTASRR